MDGFKKTLHKCVGHGDDVSRERFRSAVQRSRAHFYIKCHKGILFKKYIDGRVEFSSSKFKVIFSLERKFFLKVHCVCLTTFSFLAGF
jgi:hypothetical protein